uniref:Fibroblast growth factor n=1 Tax=Clastoptera arizonana TaxID=38151 RepID=A0A1B6BZU2_9HEMI
MRLTLYTLPKLAVSAKLLCLLMVVICGAVPSMVRSVRLYNDCAGRYVRADTRGRVFADADESDKFQNLTIRSTDFSLKLTIFGEESKRYLCFNKKWKIVGSLRDRGPMCQFYEEMAQNGYSRFRSAADKKHFLGFNRRGRPLKGSPQVKSPNPKCLNFLKFDAEFSIPDFNAKMAEGGVINHSLYRERLLFFPNRPRTTSEPSQPTHRLRHNRKKYGNP